MLSGAKGVLVGYSGGADSSALLTLMCEERGRSGIYIKAVHVHHGIRGGEADRDAKFCEDTCKRLGIDFELVKADIPTIAKLSGRGIEETARDFRYSEFSRILSSDERLDVVATAHNSDDNAETMLYNLIRGTGVAGLSGIPPMRKLGDYTIIRPLIGVTKDEIIDFCKVENIGFIHDSTNDDILYTRNYIRHELIPGMKKLNPAFPEAAGRLSRLARDDDDCLSSLAEELVKNRNPCADLANAHRAIASRAVIKMYSEVSGATLETVHIDAVLALCAKGRGELSLPDRVFARIADGKLVFTREKISAAPEFFHEIHPGVNHFAEPDFAVLMYRNDGSVEKDNEILKKIYNLSIHIRLNSDTINHILFVRERRPGDSYVSGGMTRKIKKLCNDRKLTMSERQRIPVFCDDEGVIWFPGSPPADRVKPEGDDFVSLVYYYNEV